MNQLEAIWAIYFANLVAMEKHPGYKRDELTPPILIKCANEADRMLNLHVERFKTLRNDYATI